jgi:hypothetical protein
LTAGFPGGVYITRQPDSVEELKNADATGERCSRPLRGPESQAALRAQEGRPASDREIRSHRPSRCGCHHHHCRVHQHPKASGAEPELPHAVEIKPRWRGFARAGGTPGCGFRGLHSLRVGSFLPSGHWTYPARMRKLPSFARLPITVTRSPGLNISLRQPSRVNTPGLSSSTDHFSV